MTLPFRRRHNDAEASHDRARSLVAVGLVEELGPDEQAWLAAHLDGCADCRTESTAYDADRRLLRTLRDHVPEPPRDLWARTAAAIDQAGRRPVEPRAPVRRSRIGRAPAGVLSGLVVVLVVLVASLVPRGVPLFPQASGAAGSPGAVPTPITVDAGPLAWIQSGPDGTYEYVLADVDQVCPTEKQGCAELGSRTTTRLRFAHPPQSVVLSPTHNALVVVTASALGTSVVVVPVATAPPLTSPGPTAASPTTGSSPGASPTGVAASGSPGPVASASGSPAAGVAIVSDVIVVGDTSYSPDGRWLAFSARPADGSAGPDLYLWRVGDPAASPVTTDHRTFFAGWLGGEILANRVDAGVPAARPSPAPAPAASPGATHSTESGGRTHGGSGGGHGSGNHPATAAPATPAPTGSAASPGAPAAPTAVPEDHPVAFILDPATRAITTLGTDMWHPTVDPTGTTISYWAGTLVPDGTGLGWVLGTGRLVIDGWNGPRPSAGPTAVPGSTEAVDPASTDMTDLATASPPRGTGNPAGTAAPDGTAQPATDAPGSSGSPAPGIGPAGHPVTIADGPISDFDAWFDPTGTRLAVWIANPTDATVGTLRLVVLDPVTHQPDPSSDPLPAVAALRGISIGLGRLAWVTPAGQDGEGSHVQVLAWIGHDFGQVRTVGAERLFVAR